MKTLSLLLCGTCLVTSSLLASADGPNDPNEIRNNAREAALRRANGAAAAPVIAPAEEPDAELAAMLLQIEELQIQEARDAEFAQQLAQQAAPAAPAQAGDEDHELAAALLQIAELEAAEQENAALAQQIAGEPAAPVNDVDPLAIRLQIEEEEEEAAIARDAELAQQLAQEAAPAAPAPADNDDPELVAAIAASLGR